MSRVTATYRLQFRGGMTFDHAIEIIPYLKRLGVSHLYASPIFTAVSGSTHGYDVTDCNAIDPALGGREGFDRLVAALKAADLGLILDIVPNHMAASLENAWWRSVVEWGPTSPFARHFDIDWREKLTLPILSRPFDEALAAGDLKLRLDANEGCLVLAYFDNLLPLDPTSYATLASAAGDDPLLSRIFAIANEAVSETADSMHAAIRTAASDTTARTDTERRLAALSQDPALISAVHAAQPWRLLYWQEASRHLSYRRFFEITGLVGVRVDDPAIFADSHRLILELVRSGAVDGLRVDHVDGLADPTGYLQSLRGEIGADTYLFVEKILEGDEALAETWPIEGTTGYEFITALAETLTDGAKAEKLAAAYCAATDADRDLEAERHAAKTLMARRNFAGEVSLLVDLLQSISVGRGEAEPQADETLRDGIVAMVTGFPVYRTYGADGGLPSRDRSLVDDIAARAKADACDKAHAAIDLVTDVLFGRVPAEARDTANRFRERFQQLTGPVMAKAIEDTLFYRFNRLIAVNEVGGDPDDIFAEAGVFHRSMIERVETQPHGLLATATHDTKRGEDARARLYTLSEAAETWAEAVDRWRAMHRGQVAGLASGPAPEPDTEWLLYQALVGAWPEDLATDDEALAALRDRFSPYVEKALREAKRRTGWTDIDANYEHAVAAYADRLLDPANTAFLNDFTTTLRPFIRAGVVNSLAQTVLKLTAPGIPDIYQGSEAADFSLVDPDNRRPVDFGKLAEALHRDHPAWPDRGVPDLATFKPHLIRIGLALRAADPDLYTVGTYLPLDVSGPMRAHVLAFARSYQDRLSITVAPRLPLALFQQASDLRAPGLWEGTELHLAGQGAFTDALSGRELEGGIIGLATVFASSPFAILTR
ncbi:malto-oligosyltrehalose synthase [Amorphus sp. 3PC139-8]|uniref:malto-oligosyltrehalose synthase n=1 Tax=Amorphus sp. 3PC139-8 TaxID=2735676 RepID=UPI00345DADB9